MKRDANSGHGRSLTGFKVTQELARKSTNAQKHTMFGVRVSECECILTYQGRRRGAPVLGRRDPQARLFDAESLIGREQIAKIPFYGPLVASWRGIFRDEDFAEFFHPTLGRPSVPQSILAVATLLQHYEGISDQETVERTKYDLRWKAVFDTDPCSLKPLFAKSSLQLFRLRLVLKKKQGLIFQAALNEAKRQGQIPKKLQIALDSTPVTGRGAVKDAFNLLSDGIKKVLRVIAAKVERDASEIAEDLDLLRHLGRDSVKGSRVVDWDDDASVQRFLAEVVADCKKVVDAATEAGVTTGEELDLLAKVVSENVEESPDGPRIPKKVPPGRTTSVHDEEMRHGRKSSGKLYTGHKIHLAVDTASQFITAIEIDEPSVAEGDHVGSLIEQTVERTDAAVEEGLGDCAYGSRKSLAQAAKANVPLVTKMPAPPKGRFGPGDFTVSEDGEEATCPAGLPSAKVGHGKAGITHRWAEELCGACTLRDRCLYGESKKRNLVVSPDFHKRRAREAYARSPEGREKLRARVIVEHAIGYLKNLGAGQARYFGRAKTLFQWLVCGAVQNLRRLFSLLPAATQLLLAVLVPLLFLVLSAVPALAVSATSETKPTPSVQEGTGEGQRSLSTRVGLAVLAGVRDPSPPAESSRQLTRHPPPLRTAAALPAGSRRWLLRRRRRPRGPPPHLVADLPTRHAVEWQPRRHRTGSSPGQRPIRRCASTYALSARSRLAESPPPSPVDHATVRAQPRRPLRLSRVKGRARGRIADSRPVRREERSCAGWTKRGTGLPRAPPVRGERNSQDHRLLPQRGIARQIRHFRPAS